MTIYVNLGAVFCHIINMLFLYPYYTLAIF